MQVVLGMPIHRMQDELDGNLIELMRCVPVSKLLVG